MEALFKDNYVLIYLLALIMFLKPNELKENQKILLVYLIAFLIDFSNGLETVVMLMITLFTLFVYLEYFNSSSFRREIMIKTKHKIIDFLFLMFAQYSLLRFLLLIFLNTSCTKNIINSFGIEYIDLIIYLIQVLLASSIANSIYGLAWKMKDLDKIKKEMDDVIQINYFPRNLDENWFEIVARLEDKSFYLRKKYTTAYSFDYLIHYVYLKGISDSNDRDETQFDFSFSLERVNFHTIKKFFKMNLNILKYVKYKYGSICNFIKSFFSRGHSTIEAQLIRSIGLEKGYDSKFVNVVKRKIFEIIYTNLVFENLKEFYDKLYYANRSMMKNYLMYIYLSKAKAVIKEFEHTGIQSVFGKSINELDQDELFIASLSIAHYYLDIDDILTYADIYNYPITENRVKELYNSIYPNY